MDAYSCHTLVADFVLRISSPLEWTPTSCSDSAGSTVMGADVIGCDGAMEEFSPPCSRFADEPGGFVGSDAKAESTVTWERII